VKEYLSRSRIRKKRAKEIKAKHYIECSAKNLSSVNEVFRSALRVVMDPLKEKKKVVEKLAKKEEVEEQKNEKKMEKFRKKQEEKDRKQKSKEGKEEDSTATKDEED